MEALYNKQKLAADQLSRLQSVHKTDSLAKKTASYTKRLIAKVEILLQDYLIVHREILKKSSNGLTEIENSYFKNQEYTNFELECMDFLAEMEESLGQVQPELENGVRDSSSRIFDSDVKLPRIMLPKFDGDYDSWPSFKDLFLSLIHRKETISKVEKLHYLKCSLSGEAEGLLRPFQITEGNYEVAWSILLDRYDNKNALMNNQFKKIFSLGNASDTSSSIKSLLDNVTEFVKNVENFGVANVWHSMVIFLATQRLPPTSREMWEQQQASNKEQSTLEELQTFLETRFRALEATAGSSNSRTPSDSTRSKRLQDRNNTQRRINGFHAGTSKQTCVVCKEEHSLMKCPRFVQADASERFAIVKQNKLCLNCLAYGHLVANCPSTRKCFKCQQTHHTMLHRESSQNVSIPQPSTSAQTLSSLNAVTPERRSIDNRSFGEVLLATALIKVVSPNRTVQLRALLDQGSQATFITEDAVQKLGLRKRTHKASVFGIGSTSAQTTSGIVNAQLLLNNGELYNMEALVLPKLTNLVPNRYIEVEMFKNLPNISLADPHFNVPGKIDLLLGADVYAQLILADVITLEDGPLLQSTRIGWIISGRIGAANSPSIQSFSIGVVENDDLGTQLKRFWELEEVTTTKQPAEDDIYAEEHYKTTVTRSNSGRYTVRLPFKSIKAKNQLGKSRYSAISTWKHMEARLERNPTLKQEYIDCLQEFLDAGYLVPTKELIENADSNQHGHYLAHHAVRKESSTTKTRIVFDASRKSSTGVSLNDVLLTGPVLQNDMLAVLIRFRIYEFAIVADIAKMFLQICLHEDDTNYQRIVWRPLLSEPIRDYRLTTVTFGLTCAPFLATRTLHQLATDEGANYPLAAKSIQRDFYVDDLLSGGHSIEEATKKRNELICMLESGGFHLRKWMSNTQELLDGIPTEDVESADVLDLELDAGYKSLGLLWHPSTDTFSYRIQNDNWKTEELCTKRLILSDIARLYDPFGWIAPVSIRAKVLMQTLWKLGLNWDDSLPEDTLDEWIDIKANLKQLGSLRIPRWMDTYSDSIIELHGFCDASLEAYAAAIYVVARRDNVTKVNLVMAKTKVAPVLPQTIPKLELCGALLLANMVHQFKGSFPSHLNTSNTFLWSDNETVLAWLRGHPSKWNTFVANRTTQIFEKVENTPWRYVPSADNPADLATRGISTRHLIDSQLWWNGPSWLKASEEQWPRSNRTPSTDLERKKSSLKCLVTNSDTNDLATIIEKFSTLTRLIRTTAYCLRFIRLASKRDTYKGHLTTHELEDARIVWVKFTQQSAFASEIKSLERKEPLKNTSKLLCLNPTLEEGLLRANGRLQNSNLSDDEKQPIILPANGRFTRLLLENIHQRTLHGGTQLMLAALRKRYWTLKARNVVKAVVHECVACFRNKPRTSTQLMGSLPTPRVTISRPFSHVGIDYCGPFNIKDRTGRGAKTHKGYVAVFVCLAVKAIHIELVNDMTTQAFIAALKRFVGRRGLCSDIYSDCGSNFIGADAELRRIAKTNNAVAGSLANDGIKWHFNPPASPHFGGLWEAGVKSIKQHLHRTLRDSSLTYEEFITTLTQIEACLNSRPLCPMYDDPTDATALTPGHFLIGDTFLHAPETNFLNERISRLDRWQHTQRLAQMFWKRWSDEYLARLQQRPKWLNRQANLKVGDLCLVKDDKFPPYRWPLAKIVELHPGKDSLVRVVTILITGTTLKRNITKIALLPTQTPHSDQLIPLFLPVPLPINFFYSIGRR